MSVWIKEGVCGDLTREMTKAHGLAVELYQRKGLNFYVTSRREGNHKAGSFHYRGDAEDFEAQTVIYSELKKHLPFGFDLVEFYVHNKRYFHLEHDRK